MKNIKIFMVMVCFVLSGKLAAMEEKRGLFIRMVRPAPPKGCLVTRESKAARGIAPKSVTINGQDFSQEKFCAPREKENFRRPLPYGEQVVVLYRFAGDEVGQKENCWKDIGARVPMRLADHRFAEERKQSLREQNLRLSLEDGGVRDEESIENHLSVLREFKQRNPGIRRGFARNAFQKNYATVAVDDEEARRLFQAAEEPQVEQVEAALEQKNFVIRRLIKQYAHDIEIVPDAEKQRLLKLFGGHKHASVICQLKENKLNIEMISNLYIENQQPLWLFQRSQVGRKHADVMGELRARSRNGRKHGASSAEESAEQKVSH